MLAIIVVTWLFVEGTIAGFMDNFQNRAWSGTIDSYGNPASFGNIEHGDSQMTESFSHGQHYSFDDKSPSNFGIFDSGHSHHYPEHNSLIHGGWEQHQHVHSYPISQHIEVTKPITIPVYKNIGVPVAQPVAIKVPHPVAIGVAQPYPIHVPVAHPVAIPVVKTVAVAVEKKVPYPVEKIIPVPVEKPVPITIEKHIPVPVEKPYPIHIPIYKHVFHRPRHSHPWGR